MTLIPKLETIYHESVVITSHYHIVVAEELDTMQEGTENDDFWQQLEEEILCVQRRRRDLELL